MKVSYFLFLITGGLLHVFETEYSNDGAENPTN